MDEIKFEIPPMRARTFVDHAAVAAALRARPGEWAVVGAYGSATSATAMAYAIRSARNKAYAPVHAFETSARTVGGEFRVYARYVGDAS